MTSKAWWTWWLNNLNSLFRFWNNNWITALKTLLYLQFKTIKTITQLVIDHILWYLKFINYHNNNSNPFDTLVLQSKFSLIKSRLSLFDLQRTFRHNAYIYVLSLENEYLADVKFQQRPRIGQLQCPSVLVGDRDHMKLRWTGSPYLWRYLHEQAKYERLVGFGIRVQDQSWFCNDAL